MKVRIKSPTKLEYKTSWACWFDFVCSKLTTIQPHSQWLIETDTVIEVPKGYVLLTMPRSSTYKNYWLTQTNSVWVIDNDYCWDNDTIKFPYLNNTWEEVTISPWERIGQWIFVPIGIVEFDFVTSMGSNEDRGGFWTTWLT